MTHRSVHALFAALNRAGVRYLVAGGLAVNAHGYLRFTKDVDLVLDLSSDNVSRALATLAELGYAPTLPVAATDFADPTIRRRWRAERNLSVFQLWSDRARDLPVDLFVDSPFEFEEEWVRAKRLEMADAGTVRFVSLPTLRRMKGAADRPQDRADLAELSRLTDDDAEA